MSQTMSLGTFLGETLREISYDTRVSAEFARILDSKLESYVSSFTKPLENRIAALEDEIDELQGQVTRPRRIR